MNVKSTGYKWFSNILHTSTHKTQFHIWNRKSFPNKKRDVNKMFLFNWRLYYHIWGDNLIKKQKNIPDNKVLKIWNRNTPPNTNSLELPFLPPKHTHCCPLVGLCCVSLCPLFGCSIMLRSVGRVLGGNASNKGISWVTVSEQGADGQQHLGDGEGRAPVVFQDV